MLFLQFLVCNAGVECKVCVLIRCE